MHLPEEYLNQMKKLLGEEYPAFLATYEKPPSRGLRVNTLKIPVKEMLERISFQLKPIPWCETGFFYDHDQDRPGKHVFHAAGLYYIQDPSAMAAAEALNPQPGEKVLDLCAAPGGKTTQIAAKMEGQGLLVANEISPQRRKALVENLERCGISHTTVLGESPERLAERFSGFFDRILIDAPCSGEGMFRKDPDTCERWSTKATKQCAGVQSEILNAASPMLRPGGILTYSTCTFNPRENEEILQRFLEAHPDYETTPVPGFHHFQPARPEWGDSSPGLSRAARLWPHHLHGEGHFIAVLKKAEGPEGTKQRPGKFPPVSADAVKTYQEFVREVLSTGATEGPFTLYGDHLYQIREDLPSLKGLKVERPGFYLGQVKRKRFVPSHTWAMTLTPGRVQRTLSFDVEDPDLYRYLRGEALPLHNGKKGWTLVTVDRFPLGWGKISGGLLKNHYPKRLRWDPI
ncbi:RsmF rRNA methyltransferase first C-terminal domain-containing protein [Paludifilum halophilum]|uniref:SAM-dependent methyltransferase n=1 Tax=Paludifilum halophilum TaxID=1642702 RepID=A0A235B7Y6_9BACL|nr:RsmB/NOP family class I SAM-dependent RNA methyltransferase [Paludifilum halophilum]OYD08342.1 SAM-dependent methyltransferase [Paludifilum halophilum]